MDVKAKKLELRDAIKQRLERMTEHAQDAEDRSTCRRILEVLPLAPATIAAFYPLADEVDIRPLLKEMEQSGYRVFLPCVHQGKLAFRKMTPREDMKKGAFGVMEPPDDAELLDGTTLDVALIPGRAFDEHGNRLGRGNGGYDVWIRAQRTLNPKTRMLGVAYSCQIAHEVPMEEHDEKVDGVLTARGLTERKG
jgi:5-formyltetrahydrofolate cyclo-ligase